MSRSGETNGRYFNGISNESFLSTKTIELQSPQVVAHANKKPSYLNLACCVNGYSNYTNYDSIERKEINKSREVSPIRPIINSISMSRQQRSNENLLSAPKPVTFVKQSPLTSITKRFASLNINDKDTTDNASVVNGNGSVTNRKSFIQQRVEKLYGTTKILTTVKSSDSIQLNGNGTIHHTNGSTNGSTIIVEGKENDDVYLNSLPVMKHLRPEFCKQLQFMNSPKKSLRSNTAENGFKTEQPKIDQKFKSENGSSGNTNVTSQPFANNKTKEISIETLNCESVKKDSDNLPQPDVCSQQPVVLSEEKPVANKFQETNTETEAKTLEMNSELKSPIAELKDGNFFLKLLNAEKSRILKVADDVEKELTQLQSDVSELNFI